MSQNLAPRIARVPARSLGVSKVTNDFLGLLSGPQRQPVVIAHRGASAHAPENTLEAAILAYRAGARAWELDVQLSRDGVAVVFHDETLVRTTDAAARFAGDPRQRSGFLLADFDWTEIATLDAGSWFTAASDLTPCASGPIRVPTLEEALALTARLDWLVNVEIKSFPEHPSGLMESVLEVIARTGTARRVLLSGFDHRQIARVPAAIAAARVPCATSPAEYSSQPPCTARKSISVRSSAARRCTCPRPAWVRNRSPIAATPGRSRSG